MKPNTCSLMISKSNVHFSSCLLIASCFFTSFLVLYLWMFHYIQTGWNRRRFCGKKRCAYFSIKMATKTSHGHFQFARLCRKPSVDYRKTKSFGFWWHGWSHRITVILWLNQYFWIQFKNQIICQLNSILLMQNEITLVVASRHFIS